MFSRSTQVIVLLLLMAIGSLNMITSLSALSRAPVAPTEAESAVALPTSASPSLGAYLALTRYHYESGATGPKAADFKYLTFFLYSTRGVAAYCDELGIDVRGALTPFVHANAAAYRQTSDRLGSSGLNSERLWQMLAGELTMVGRLTVNRLAMAGDMNASHACHWLVDNPDAYAGRQNFERLFPTEHARLAADRG